MMVAEVWSAEGGSQREPVSPLLAQEHTRSLRILMVATEAPPVRGGIARVVGSLTEGLRQQGHQIDILAYPEVRRLVCGEIRLSSLVFKLPRLLHSPGMYDLVHVHGITPTVSDVTLLFTCLFYPRLPVVYTHHVDLDMKPAGFLNRIYNALHHWLSRRSGAVIAATSDTLALLGQNRQSCIIPFGVDSAYFSMDGRRDQRFTVLFVGQFRPWKGVKMLLRAMSDLPQAHLLLAGHGPEEGVYRALADKLGLDVEFHVGLSDEQLRQLYQRAHVVVAPSTSRLEAFGLALVEGMAAGCVPVASDLPGVREVVGPVGRLFPVGDVESLGDILRELWSHPVQVQQMGARAHFYATRFSQGEMIRAYESLFRKLVARQESSTQAS